MRKTLLVSFVVCTFFFSGAFSQANALPTAAQQEADAQAQADKIRSLQSRIAELETNIAGLQNQAQSPSGGGGQDALKQAQQALQGLQDQLKQATAPLTAANKMCNPFYPECPCRKRPSRDFWGSPTCIPGENTANCRVGVCFEIPQPGLRVDGRCLAQNKCKAEIYDNLEGKSTGVGDIGGIVGQIFKGILDKVMGGGGAGGGAGGTGYQGCTQYYQVTVPSTDPCAQYVPPTSSSLLDTNIGQNNASDLLLNALQGGTQSSLGTNLGTDAEQNSTPVSVSGNILNLIKTNTLPKGTTSSATSTLFSSIFGEQAVHLQSGTQGNIVITGTGATVVANSRDPQTNSEVAGFYGSDTFGNSQPQGLVAQMCESRPWAGSVVSFVIPPAFFDSLCVWRGYQVGVSQVAPAPQLQTPSGTTVQQNTITPAPTPVSTIAPSVDIWATPATVTLGSRTSIFWNAKGVVSCTETSPSGNFSQNTFSGGASTVPLSGATTFVISCLTADGMTVTDSVTVNLAI